MRLDFRVCEIQHGRSRDGWICSFHRGILHDFGCPRIENMISETTCHEIPQLEMRKMNLVIEVHSPKFEIVLIV